MSLYREYRSSAHSKCNLKYSVPEKAPIAFYNWSKNLMKHCVEIKLNMEEITDSDDAHAKRVC